MRVLYVGMWAQFLQMSRAPLLIIFNVLTPIIYATIAMYLYGPGQPDKLLQASVGAGLMGVWSSVLFGAGGAIQNKRWSGMLEPIITAPTPFSAVLLSISLATSVVGMYAMVATVFWGAVFFAIPLAFPSLPVFLAATAVCVLSMGMMGLLLASTFVFMRNANALANTLDHPIWLLSGMLVPITTLPSWLQPVTWALPTTWGAAAVHGSVRGTAVGGEIAGTLVIGLAYVLLSLLALRRVEMLARERATLALA
ncbi:ABC transporter permease [Actinomadura sp. ATCC 31491]|uniref:Transport permease protein n=1 Tax=Actinomadura luzonensis TaxID=2805427 RepID=A0ABT0FJC5_9ACTN|nr:ABC transporter permease [Actinomadura luzonensis]MCK2212410.1 ABC transporter permease [Actinomadura luzonensis]